MNLRDTAIEALAKFHQDGKALNWLIHERGSWLTAGDPAVWVVMGAGCLYLTRDGSQSVKVKAGQIGVAFHHKNGRCEHGIFDVKELWEEVTGVHQLRLWLE